MYGMTSGLSARGFMAGQAPFLSGRGWDVALACSREGDVEAFCATEGISFWPIPFDRNPSVVNGIKGWRALWRTLRHVTPDVTVWGSPQASLLGTFACRLQRIPAVYVLHGLRLEGATGLKRRVLRFLEAVTCRMATVVVADGYELRDVAERLKVVRPGRAQVLAHGSANGVSPQAGAPRYRQELGLSDHDVIVAFAGRITTDKGVADLAAAWSLLATEHPDANLVIAGRPDSADPRANELETALARLPRTHLLGHIDDLDRLWADADLAVLPSYREGLPLVIIEAAAAGVPAVMTDCTGGAECVVDGTTGLIVPQRNPAALADAVSRLLDDPTLRREMGAAAKQRALARYDREVLWAAYEGLLRRVKIEADRSPSRSQSPPTGEEHAL